MFKEEKYIEKQFGKANHFNVPNGYFEGFTSKMMDRLSKDGASGTPIVPISAKPGFWLRYRRVIGGVAAGVCIAMFSVGMLFHNADGGKAQQHEPEQQIATSMHHSDSNIDAVVDYSMMDTDDMYAYMADVN